MKFTAEFTGNSDLICSAITYGMMLFPIALHILFALPAIAATGPVVQAVYRSPDLEERHTISFPDQSSRVEIFRNSNFLCTQGRTMALLGELQLGRTAELDAWRKKLAFIEKRLTRPEAPDRPRRTFNPTLSIGRRDVSADLGMRVEAQGLIEQVCLEDYGAIGKKRAVEVRIQPQGLALRFYKNNELVKSQELGFREAKCTIATGAAGALYQRCVIPEYGKVTLLHGKPNGAR